MTSFRGRRWPACKILFVAWWAFSLPAQAEQEGIRKNTIKAAPSFIDSAHSAISTGILDLSNSIDSFFGEERIDEEANDTRLRFYTETNYAESEQPGSETAFRMQLKLPKTEKRLQLVVQNDERETEPGAASQGTEASQTGVRENVSETTTAALRYWLDSRDINFSTDTGVRLKWPPQVFARARIRKNVTFGQWAFRPIQKILWVDREGWSSETDLNFDRRLDDVWLFRYSNLLTWNDSEHIARFHTGPVFYQKVSDKTAISYSALAFWESRPKWFLEKYALAAGFRQLLYKEWFFWEVTPVLSFPKAKNFRRSPGLAVRFEAIFGRI